MQHTLVAVFDNRSDAQSAMDELLASGFDRSDLNVSSADPTGQTSSVTGEAPRTDDTHAYGVGHSIGYSIRHFFTTLFGSDNDEHVQRYSDVVARGHHVLTLTTESEPDVERAADIIERFGPVDLDERHDLSGPASSLDAGMLAADASKGSGLSSASMQSGTAGSGSLGSGSLGTDTGSLGVASSSVGTGSLGSMQGTQPGALQGAADEDRNFFATQNLNDPVPKGTTYQEPMGANMQAGGSMDSNLGGNTLSGTQSSGLDSGLSSSRQTAQGGSLSQSDSALQGTRTLQDSENASLGGTARVAGGSMQGGSQSGSMQRDMTKMGSMRVLSRDSSGTSGTSSRYGTDDSDWRSDWDTNYSSLGGSYDDYEPAYRYGNEMRSNGKYKGRHWDDVESDLRSDWDTRYAGSGASTWERFKAAVRHGWNKINPDMDDDDSYYRSHWSSTYGSVGDSYDDYEPAYRYGNEMRSYSKYKGRHWDDVESDLRSDWDTRYTTGGPSTWEKMKAAVRHGWDRMTD